MRQISYKMDKASVKLSFPPALEEFLEWLVDNGFSAWIIGGAVRNALLGIPVRDWDVVTDAPEEFLRSSPFRSIPVGARFGILLMILDGMPVEVACIRKTTSRGTIEADMARRDFTVNTMAVSYNTGEFIDRFNGIRDLRRGVIRGVNDPEARFLEDPLRIIRAARFVSEYGFTVEKRTFEAMKRNSPLLSNVAIERIRDEFFKLITGTHVGRGLEILRKTGAFKAFFPEILEGWRKRQNNFHSFHVYRHIIETVSYTPPVIRVRLAALFHDIAKPRVRQKIDGRFRFFNHEKVSSEMAEEILTRWKVNRALIEEVVVLVKNHMVHNLDKWSDGAVRRLINRVGMDLLEDLFDLLRADRMAHGVDPTDISDIEVLKKRVERIINDHPHSVKELPVSGHDVMAILNMEPGPEVGRILRALHQHVMDHPKDNERGILLKMIPLIWESIKPCVKTG